MSDSDNVNLYISIALIAGIIAVLAIAFYYQFETGPSNKAVVPVVTVTATKVVVVVVGNSTTCTD
ncbi:MAG TPA: hypothetical protein VED17_03710, partial [Nitrososphaerales archaeon]|nr:hypothetical protein [Nitrososphaerales archaeon]